MPRRAGRSRPSSARSRRRDLGDHPAARAPAVRPRRPVRRARRPRRSASWRDEPVSLANLAWVRRNYLSSLDNIVLDDEAVAIEEAALFKAAGGGTIVDAGSIGIRPDPLALRRISERDRAPRRRRDRLLHRGFPPADDGRRPSDDALTERIVRDLRDGIDDTGIRAGIIGEVGCSWPLHPDERRSLRAAARAQRETGAADQHPSRPRPLGAVRDPGHPRGRPAPTSGT